MNTGPSLEPELGRLREAVAPHLPTLYAFIARRTPDAADAQDALVETLLYVGAVEPVGNLHGAQLLGRLIRAANRVLRANVEQEPSLQAGLHPSLVRLPVGTSESISRLPPDWRDAIGMELLDGLPVTVIAEALDKDPSVVESIRRRAWWRVREEDGARVERLLAALPTAPDPAPLTPARESEIWWRLETER